MPHLKGFPAGTLVLALWLIAGCGRPEEQAVPVSGVVTLDGQPVPNVLVVFSPTQGAAEDPNLCPGSSGVTDENGRFELETFSGRGAIVGEHVVSLIHKDPTAGAASSESPGPHKIQLPREASDRSLRFVVPASGANEVKFALQSNRDLPTGGSRAAELAAAIGGGALEAAGPVRPSSETSSSGDLPPRSAEPPGEEPGATRHTSSLYAAAVSVWFATLVGCFFWWRVNLRLLRERGCDSREAPPGLPGQQLVAGELSELGK